MATLLHSESRRLYSWWWDSHIPKNSKWLQENLTDMDAKVKAMIKLIEEDADSFARRAEMYYKKRPELMKLVEEFYRAYRALAERYDHATVELRHAHRTMEEAFPSQVPFAWTDESPSGSSDPGAEPHTPETLHPNRAVFDPEDLNKDALGLSPTHLHALRRIVANSEESSSEMGRRGLKQLNETCVSDEWRMKKGQKFNEVEETQTNTEDQFSQISSENQNLKQQVIFESDRALKAENEVQSLNKTLAEIQAEKEALFVKYQQSSEKLSNLEAQLNHALKDVGRFDERASKADTEIKRLKEMLSQLEANRDTALFQYNQCLERISSLENLLSLAQEDVKGQNERAIQAESETQHLKHELFKLVAEKEAGLLQYKKCLEKISSLEGQISLAEKNAALLREKIKQAESEVKALNEALAKLNEENEALAIQYKQCMERMAKLENEMSKAQVDAERLKSEVLMGAAKLKCTEQQCDQLERSNKSLRLEAHDLLQKISRTDQELLEKNDELKKLKILMQDEHSRFLQVEATLQALKKVHSQSQEDHRVLAFELKDGLRMLKDMETCKQVIEDEAQRVKEENRSLNGLNITCTVSLKNLQDEIFSLKEIKEKLEREVAVKEEQSNSLHQEIFYLNAEIKDLSEKYQAIMKQVESVGLNPECIESSVKDLQDENSRLNEICKREKDEREVLYGKMKDMSQLSTENAIMLSSLSGLNSELEGLREKVKALQESCDFLHGEKSNLVSEKGALLSQLQIITENMQKLLEKNTLLENSLSSANVELEQLRLKSKDLEQLCQLIKNEKSSLLNERSNLVSQLENVKQRLGILENRFRRLEERYSDLEKEKELTIYQVEELRDSLLIEKQERVSYMQSSETRLEGLQNHFRLLQEERKLGKKEFEEELDKAVNVHIEIFILQKFIEDLEEKNLSLLIECHKHVEASKFSDKLISELESENLEQQVEAELLVDEIKKLRLGIYQVFMAVQSNPNWQHAKKSDREQISIQRILDSIYTMKGSLLKTEDEEQQLLVENSVFLTILTQFRAEGIQLESEKEILERRFENSKSQHYMLQKDMHELLEIKDELKSELSKKEEQEQALKANLETLCVKLINLQTEYLVLQKQNSKVLDENKCLLHNICDLKEEKNYLEKDNSAMINEAVKLTTFSLVLERFMSDKASELQELSKELYTLGMVNGDLKQEIGALREELAANKVKNLHLNDSIEKLNKEVHEVKYVNDQLSLQVLLANDFLKEKTAELSEAEQKVTATGDFNLELSRTVEEMKMESEELKINQEILAEKICELSKTSMYQTKKIESLCEGNINLETEVGVLCKEIEEHRTREENLCLELQGKNSEFELFEAEATTFYFDLQSSAVREVYLENKVHELVGVCEILEEENTAKIMQMEQIKARVIYLESQIGGLEAQLSAYVPVINSLRENVSSLEHNYLLKRNLVMAGNHEKGVEIAVDPPESGCQEPSEDKSTVIPNGIMDLQKMQATIKAMEIAMVEEMDMLAIEAIEKVVVEEVKRLTKEELVTMDIKAEAELQQSTESLTSKVPSPQEEDTANAGLKHYNDLGANNKFQKTKPENGILMKDIPLDQVSDQSFHGRSRRKTSGAEEQMLKLWESSDQYCSKEEMFNEIQNLVSVPKENDPIFHRYGRGKKKIQDSSEVRVKRELGIDKREISCNILPNKEGNKGRILERLASDAKKLTSLQRDVQDLKKKLEINKRRNRASDAEFETVKEQLLEVEEVVVQLAGVNGQIRKDIEECPSALEGKTSPKSVEVEDILRNKTTEQARKGSEKIGRLQLEVQNIQYILLKLQDDNKNKRKSKFSQSKTGVLLRDFIHKGKRRSPKKKKACLCGCRRPLTKEE